MRIFQSILRVKDYIFLKLFYFYNIRTKQRNHLIQFEHKIVHTKPAISIDNRWSLNGQKDPLEINKNNFLCCM